MHATSLYLLIFIVDLDDLNVMENMFVWWWFVASVYFCEYFTITFPPTHKNGPVQNLRYNSEFHANSTHQIVRFEVIHFFVWCRPALSSM